MTEEIKPYDLVEFEQDCSYIKQRLSEALVRISLIHDKCRSRKCTFPSWNSLFCVFLTEESKITQAFYGFHDEFRRINKYGHR